MASRIAGNSNTWSITCSVMYYSPFVMAIQQWWPLDSPHFLMVNHWWTVVTLYNGTVMRKAFSHHQEQLMEIKKRFDGEHVTVTMPRHPVRNPFPIFVLLCCVGGESVRLLTLVRRQPLICTNVISRTKASEWTDVIGTGSNTRLVQETLTEWVLSFDRQCDDNW